MEEGEGVQQLACLKGRVRPKFVFKLFRLSMIKTTEYNLVCF